jgi:hypothetical protein
MPWLMDANDAVVPSSVVSRLPMLIPFSRIGGEVQMMTSATLFRFTKIRLSIDFIH